MRVIVPPLTSEILSGHKGYALGSAGDVEEREMAYTVLIDNPKKRTPWVPGKSGAAESGMSVRVLGSIWRRRAKERAAERVEASLWRR